MRRIIQEKIILKDYLKTLDISKAMIKRIKNHGDFLVNGQHVTVRYLLQKDDVLDIIFPLELSCIEPDDIPLKIVYEDEYYLVIDKQANIPCIPTKRYPHHTLANGLIKYFNDHHILATVHLVNRLDKETQGLMLIAKDSRSHYLLSQDIKQVKRVYHCLVEGTFKGEGIIDSPIAKAHDSIKRIISKNGKEARTYYRVLKNIEDKTLVECILDTGRTHQIRVHLSSIGYPLAGDQLYGAKENTLFYLDSVELSFVHPYTKEFLEFKKEDKYDCKD